MRIEIISTPNDTLKETGFGGLKACKSVLESIKKQGHEVRLSICKSSKDLYDVVRRNPDLAVLAVKYISTAKDQDIWLSDYFSRHAINYTGSPRDILTFDSDKVHAKWRLRSMGVQTANYLTAVPGQYKNEKHLTVPFPLFLKPTDAANGNGVDDASLVTSFAQFEIKLSSLHARFQVPVLAEEFLNGREFTVAIIKSDTDKLIVSLIEIVPLESTNGLRILGEEAKKADSEELKKPEDSELVERVKALAIDVFNKLGVRDFGRVDIKTKTSGECFFLETNLVPGMTAGSSYFPKACEIGSDLSYDKVIELIIANGLNRVRGGSENPEVEMALGLS
ncbi:hypothetical protein N9C83_02835 [Opitutales bacterium]|nr:hypothetical protein [Opitutales bacterium]